MTRASLLALLFALAVPPMASAAEWALAPGACAPRPGFAAATLVFGDVRGGRGDVVVTVYGDRPEDFLAKGKKLAKLAVLAVAGGFEACLSLPAPGIYAITAFHDEDSSGRLGRNLIGLPSEGYGFPNGAEALLGPPGFDKVALRFDEGVTVVPIPLRYP